MVIYFLLINNLILYFFNFIYYLFFIKTIFTNIINCFLDMNLLFIIILKNFLAYKNDNLLLVLFSLSLYNFY